MMAVLFQRVAPPVSGIVLCDGGCARLDSSQNHPSIHLNLALHS
jgi:hypothetical protein